MDSHFVVYVLPRSPYRRIPKRRFRAGLRGGLVATGVPSSVQGVVFWGQIYRCQGPYKIVYKDVLKSDKTNS